MAMATMMGPVLDLKVLNSSSAVPPDVDAHMQRFLRPVRANPVPANQEPVQAGDPALAEDLIARATRALDVLARRCHQLEREATIASEAAKSREQEQTEAVAQWQKLASGMKVHAQRAEKDLADAKQKAQALEARASAAEARIAELERSLEGSLMKAASAEQLSSKLHDLVTNAFGSGSAAHDILEHVVGQRDAAVVAAAA